MSLQAPSIEFIAAAKALTGEAREAALARFDARFGKQTGAAALSEQERIAIVLQKDAEDLCAWRGNLARLRQTDANAVSP